MEALQDVTLDLLSALLGLRASRISPSAGRSKNLYVDILRLSAAVAEDVDITCKPLLVAILEHKPDTEIWIQVYEAVTAVTNRTPQRKIAPSVIDTPIRFSSSVINSSEHRNFMDLLLQQELGPFWVDLDIYTTFFGSIGGLKEVAEAVFKECSEGDEPLFDHGWRDWPEITSEENVLAWLQKIAEHLTEAAQRHTSMPIRQQLVGLPHEPLKGSVASRKMDVGFIDSATAITGSLDSWSHIIVPGELKKNTGDDGLKSWLDLARYVREVFYTQDTRRFVLGFTLCGPIMRIWNFDRTGAIGSAQLDINQNALQFVSVILAFLLADAKSLGFDPTIQSSEDERYIEIDQKGQKKRLILDQLMTRSHGILTRGTTCWKVHFEGEPVPMVLKESWQHTERDEGALLRLAAEKGVTNVARHVHDWTVQVDGRADNVQENIRRGLDIQKGKKFFRSPPPPPRQAPAAFHMTSGLRLVSAGKKRSSSQTGAVDSSSKRQRSESPIKPKDMVHQDRVHQRVLMRECGKAIYLAESPAILLESIAQCVGGHKALYEAGILHRDISLNNLMINVDRSNPSSLGFLIDLDLATKISRETASGAAGRTGTRAFMSIGVLLGDSHSFMDDLESFFWVLYWICVHFESSKTSRPVDKFEKWNYEKSLEELASYKYGVIGEDLFDRTLESYCTDYYRPLIPCLRNLWKIIFPGGRTWKKEDLRLYGLVQDVLREAQKGLIPN